MFDATGRLVDGPTRTRLEAVLSSLAEWILRVPVQSRADG
jgi:hypothetical protein